jgi:RNA polymerase sigma factor FliA
MSESGALLRTARPSSARKGPAPGVAEALFSRYRETGDVGARAQLLDLYLGLVHYGARELVRTCPAGVEVDELVSAGTLGLVQALDGFDPARGLAFSTYAMPRIRGAMLDELRSRDWMPRTVRTRGRQIKQARATLQQKLGRAPGEAEMAGALGVDLETYRRWASESQARILLEMDRPVEVESGGGVRLAETIPDEAGEQPGESLARAESRDALRAAIESLSAKDRLVLSLYYYEGLTLKQIGEVMHVTESRISQIHSRVLERLRERIGSVEGE